jgi:hypothetical protein
MKVERSRRERVRIRRSERGDEKGCKKAVPAIIILLFINIYLFINIIY